MSIILYTLAVATFGALIGGTAVWLIWRAERQWLKQTVPTELAVDVRRVSDGLKSLRAELIAEREIVVPLPEDLEINAQVDADIAAGRSPF